MTDADIKSDVLNVIESRHDRLPADWIVQWVIALHDEPEGPDADFWLCCAEGHVRAVVRQTLQRIRGEWEESPEQLTLPGFERLQRMYIVEHDGELQVVPIEQMTEAEIRMKIEELRRMARGCATHAKELERYLNQFGTRAA